jgi:hypothetical protein
MISRGLLPSVMPGKKILAVDIGGTLAKAAFYVPKGDPLHNDTEGFKALT